MEHRFISTEQKEQVEVLRLNDPATLNAVSFPMMEEMAAELARVESDAETRVLVLTGEGRGFCSGANIKQMAALGGAKGVEAQPGSVKDLAPHLTYTRGVIHQLWKLSKPTIAAINGPCITTGVGLAAACDFRVASDQARIGWIFLRRGLPPDDGSLGLLVKLLGYSKTYKLGILGEIISAQEAMGIGLVDQVVPHQQLLSTCLGLAQRMVDAGPPLAQQMFKRLANEAQYSSYEDTARQVRLAFQTLVETEDHAEAVRAFAEKRQPRWKGK
jgi:2-(1,2-epoxy-1,2-dihydrophenyl)acetyl-CoA isomerase